jgi:hypothetical protein
VFHAGVSPRSIRDHGVNHEMNIHQASEVWTEDFGGPSHLSVN